MRAGYNVAPQQFRGFKLKPKYYLSRFLLNIMVFLSIFFICMLGNKRRIQHYIKSHLGPYFMHPLSHVCPLDFTVGKIARCKCTFFDKWCSSWILCFEIIHFSQIFCDFGESFTVVDTNGEQPVSNMISSVSKVIVLCCALMTQFLFLIIFTAFVQSLEFLKKVLK